MTSQELPPMRVQYSGHVIQAETLDHYTALPFVEVLVCIYEFSYKFDPDLNKFLETGTLGRTRKGSEQTLVISFQPIPPFIFPLQSLKGPVK